MDSNTARVLMMAVIGGSVAISMIVMAIARIVVSRRRHPLPDAGIDRLEERLTRIEHAIDAMATEVERVSEHQRFTSRLLAEGKSAGHEAVPGPMMEQSYPAERRR